MKIVTYKCDECKGEIYNNQFLEISSADPEIGFNIINNFDGQIRRMNNWSEMHYCSQDCLNSRFFGAKKTICEPVIEVGVDHGSGTDHLVEVPASDFDKQVKSEIIPEKADAPAKNKGGWPKGKPRGPQIAENLRKNKVQEVKEPEVLPVVETPKKLGRRPADNDVFIQKLEFAKSLGYETISAALADIDKYEFEKRFSKSRFSK